MSLFSRHMGRHVRPHFPRTRIVLARIHLTAAKEMTPR